MEKFELKDLSSCLSSLKKIRRNKPPNEMLSGIVEYLKFEGTHKSSSLLLGPKTR